jgi:hypothetical protein
MWSMTVKGRLPAINTQDAESDYKPGENESYEWN